MRTLQLSLLTALFFACCHVGTAQVKNGFDKECKKVCRQLQKDGWSVYGSTQSMDAVLLAYYKLQQEKGDRCRPLTGMGSGTTVAIALRRAVNNANVQYASMQGSQVNSRLEVTGAQEVTSDTAAYSESLRSSSVSSVSQHVRSLSPNFTLVRQRSDGVVEVQAYCLVEL